MANVYKTALAHLLAEVERVLNPSVLQLPGGYLNAIMWEMLEEDSRLKPVLESTTMGPRRMVPSEYLQLQPKTQQAFKRCFRIPLEGPLYAEEVEKVCLHGLEFAQDVKDAYSANFSMLGGGKIRLWSLPPKKLSSQQKQMLAELDHVLTQHWFVPYIHQMQMHGGIQSATLQGYIEGILQVWKGLDDGVSGKEILNSLKYTPFEHLFYYFQNEDPPKEARIYNHAIWKKLRGKVQARLASIMTWLYLYTMQRHGRRSQELGMVRLACIGIQNTEVIWPDLLEDMRSEEGVFIDFPNGSVLQEAILDLKETITH